MENERYLIKNYLEKFVFSVLLVLGLTFTMGFYSGRNVFVRLNDMEVELGDKLPSDIIDYVTVLTDKNNLAIESNVPLDIDGYTTEVGEYTYYLVYDDLNYKYTKQANDTTAIIRVVDTTKPIIKVEDNIKIDYNSILDVSKFASCIDLSKCTLELLEDVDTSKSGSYEITIRATDLSNNKSEVKANITVLEKPVRAYRTKNFSYLDEINNNLNSSLTEDEKNELRLKIVEFAKQYVGNPYVYGGTSLTDGIDCSGFTMKVYANFGYSLPRVAPDQGSVGKRVSASELLPGDIIVYYYENGNGHVGIYDGNGKIIHASTPSRGIMYEDVYNGYKVYQRIIY